MTNHRLTIAAAIATILASLSLYPIFIGALWFWAGAGAVVAVAGAGTLTRLRQLPVIVCLAGGLLGLLLYLNLAFEAAHSLLWVIPTPGSIGDLWRLAGDGLSKSNQYAPPVPPVRGMVLLAAGGIGLAAVLVDLLAVRLRSSALAGLPLLMLFTEPFTVSVTRSALGTTSVFCLGAAGYLAMLSVDGRDRIRVWGRSQPKPQHGPDTSALAAAGRRVGLASVVVALCAPLLVPGLHATRLFSGGLGIGGNGKGSGGSVQLPDPEVQLQAELKESQPQQVLTYRTAASAPGYLQVYVLDTLTNSGWQMFGQSGATDPLSSRLPPPVGLRNTESATNVTTSVSIAKNVSSGTQTGGRTATFLPVPYPATRISVSGQWQADPANLMILSSGTQLAGLSYTVNSLDVDPPTQVLDDAGPPPTNIADSYLKVPSAYGSLRSLALRITAKAKTPFGKALALQNYFDGSSSRFSYTLNAPTITSASDLANFLNSRRGYCQQFSYAMAVLARLIGIPSTVAIGYTQGTHVSSDTWVVKTSDAHAWPELYFQGAGWIRFEPTPAGADGQGTATPPTYTIPVSGSSQTGSPPPGGGGTTASPPSNSRTPAGLKNLLPPPGEDSAGRALAASPKPDRALPFLYAAFALLALLVLAVIVPATARQVIRYRRWRPARLTRAAASAAAEASAADQSAADAGAEDIIAAGVSTADAASADRIAADQAAADTAAARAAWRELRDDLTDYRVGYLPSESPRALARRVTARLRFAPQAAEAMGRVAIASERAQYSARPCPSSSLRHDSTVLRHAIAAAVPRRARWRARIFPASVLTPVVIGVSQVVDVFSRVNPAVLRRLVTAGRHRPAEG